MQQPFFDQFSVAVNSSRTYTIASFTVELLAIASVWLANISWFISVGLTIVILIVSIRSNHRFVFLAHPHSVKELTFREKCWFLRLANHKEIRVKVVGDILINTFIIVLNLRDQSGGKTYPLVLFKDAISPTKHRRLRMLLKVRS